MPGAWGYEVCLYTRPYPPGETYFVTVRAYGYMGGRKCYSEDCFVSNIP